MTRFIKLHWADGGGAFLQNVAEISRVEASPESKDTLLTLCNGRELEVVESVSWFEGVLGTRAVSGVNR